MNSKRNFIYFGIMFLIAMSSLLYSQAAGDSTSDPIIGAMRLVPATNLAGTPQGSHGSEPGHSPNEIQFIHILTKNLWVMETEVTQQMWTELQVLQPDLPTVTSGFTGDNRPADNVTWNQAILFANLLSLENGLTRCYYADPGFTIPIDSGNYTGEEFEEVYCDFNAEGYRLPTEGEWEYFTRAGNSAPFSLAEPGDQYGTLSSCIPGALPSLETAAWYCVNSGSTTHPVGTKIANSWNLKDLPGNVSEWCWDWWGLYPVGTQTDYQGPVSGVTRVIRGGHWGDNPSSLRPASRSSFSPDLGSETIGFRLVRTLGMSVTSPRGGEKSRVGTTQRISWTPGRIAGETMTNEVTVALYRGEVFETFIGTAPLEKGILSWTIPREQTPDSDYRVRIYQGDIQVYSPGDFSITASETYTVMFQTDGTPGATLTGTTPQTVNHGADCTPVTANVPTGYHFVNWTGTGGFVTSTDNPLTVTDVTSNMTITANFAINTYTVMFIAGAGGTVTGTTPQTVNHGSNCTAVTAVPNTNYYFVNWTGTGGFITTTANPLTVTNVTANMTITANFAINTYTVTFTVGAGGTVTGTTPQTVNHGSNCTAVTAVPNANYHFVNWTGTGGFITTTANPLTVTNVTANMTITANFAINTYTVMFIAGAGGTVTGTTPQTVNHGSNCTAVTAVPNANYHFVNWTGTGGFVTKTNNPLTVTNVTANMTITANFAINTYTVTFTAGAGGTVSGTTSQIINHGSNCTAVTAVPNAYYHFVNWTGTGGFITTTANPLTVTNVTANMTITANFAIDQYTVTFQVDTDGASNGRYGGTLNGTKTQTIAHGGNCTPVQAVPNPGYAFVNWTGPGGFTSTDNPLTVTKVTAEMAFTAHFVTNTLTVSFQTGSGGTLSGTTSQAVNYGGNCMPVTAVPNTGYHFVNWTGTGGFVTTTANPLTVTNVTSSMTITANFSNTLPVNFKARPNGTLTGATTQEVPYGGNCTPVTAVPNTGYHFFNWTGTGGFITTTENPLTVTNVTTGMEITANFAIDTYTVTFVAGANGVVDGTLSQTVDHGSNCTSVTAIPNANYHLVNWTGTSGFVSTNNPLIVGNVTANMTITANFAIDTYTVNFVGGYGGTLSGTTSQEIPHGGNCTAITAVPNTGYTFTNWTGTGGFVTKTDNPLTVTNVTDNMTITANFTINTYTVTFTAGSGGSLTGDLVQTVAHGGNCTAVTAVPNTGKKFVNWTGTGGFITTTSNPLTVTNVTANMGITANFSVSTFRVTFQVLAQDQASGRSGGTLSGQAAQVVNYGGSCSAVTAVPGSKYNFVNWTGTGGFVTTSTNPLTVTNVTSDMEITANFVLKKCTLTFLAGTGGTLNGFTSQEVDYNGTGSPVTAVPNNGYIFVNWSGTGGFTSPDNPLSVKNVTINMTITANFKQGTPSGS